jgi:hypothetical protein
MLSKADAQTLTEQAQNHAYALGTLLMRLHDGQAWKPLGFPSWTTYVAASFDESLRTIQRYVRQEQIREIVGHDNLARFTGEAIEALADPDHEYMSAVANIAAHTVDGRINADVVRSVQAAVTETLITGAVDIDGEQYAVGDALVAGVQGVMREGVLKKRAYIVANVRVMRVAGGNGDNIVTLAINMDDDVYKDRLAYNALQPVYISIWRELP